MSKRNWKRVAKSWREDALAWRRQNIKDWGAMRKVYRQRDDARQWSAAWKQAAKDERRERLMYTRQDVKLDYAHFEPGNLQAMLEHPVFQVISQTMWEMLEAAPAPNYIEWQMHPRDEQGESHDIVLTAQRCEGKTPHTCRKEAEAATNAATERIATLEGLLRRWVHVSPIAPPALSAETRAALGAAPTEPAPSQSGETALFDTMTLCETCGALDCLLRGKWQTCDDWKAKSATPIDTREVDVMEWEGGEQ